MHIARAHECVRSTKGVTTEPATTLIFAHNPGAGVLVVSAPGMPDLRLSLAVPGSQPVGVATPAVPADKPQPGSRKVQVLGDRISAGLAAVVSDDNADVAAWFTAAVGVPCALVRQLPGARSPVLGRPERDRSRATSLPPQTPAAVDAASAASAREAGGAEAQAEQAEQADLSTGPVSSEPGLVSISSRAGDSIGEHCLTSG